MGGLRWAAAALLLATTAQVRPAHAQPAGLVKNCSCPSCVRQWGPAGCPDLYSVAPDLVRPAMQNQTAPGPGRRVREVHPDYAHTKAYHALYLPIDWTNATSAASGRGRFPLIVEFMGNGPWTDGEDVSTGRPEDSNLGYGISAGRRFVWVSMPFLSSDLGANTEISTYWWGCPSDNAAKPCGTAFNATPTLDYTRKTVQLVIDRYNVDADNVILTGWSRGAIACGAIGLFDGEMAKLWRAFVPYSHLDGDCGWVDEQPRDALLARYGRLDNRPQLVIAECNVATQIGVEFLRGLNVTGNFTFMTTGFRNHNDAWVLRPSKSRTALRAWLDSVLAP